MASKIRIKRSTGTTAPSSLLFGELGYTDGVGTHGNKGYRVFVGDAAGDVDVIGGRYYTDLLSIEPGKVASQTNPTTTANGFVAICDQNRKVDEWNVDNITIDGNVISTTDTNGDLTLAPEQTGSSPTASGSVIIPDDTYLAFGNGKDGRIEYNENGDDKVHVTGATWVFNCDIQQPGGASFGCVGISSNIIKTMSGCGNQLFLDPYPDGLSNEGTVIIKGDLQVDGTTTTVNSTSATVNDAIFSIGDVTSTRSVLTAASVGVSTIAVDSVVGINTGDVIAVAGLPGAGTTIVTSYDTSAKTITFSGITTAGINTTSQVTVTHSYDTQTDRGISFHYNTSSGTTNNKQGFFGYIDSAGESANGGNTNVPERAFTYIPDATVTGNTATGVRGFLDIKGIYYQGASGGEWSSNGAIYFDTTGKMTSTGTPASGVSTSNYVLTTVGGTDVPVWTDTLDGGTF